MRSIGKRKLVAGAAVALVVAGGGAAFAASKFTSPKQESQAVINDAAQQLGIDPTKLSNALKKALEDRVDAAVADGRLTKAEGDALKARIESGELPLLFPGAPPKFGHHEYGPELDTAATYLGLTEAQLQSELEGGKTLAQIATDHGKTVDGLVAALLEPVQTKLDAAVAAGRMTQAEADSMLAGLKARITDLVNGRFPHPFGVYKFGYHEHAPDLAAAASYLGLTEDQLKTELESGKTLAQVATQHGKTVDGLVAAMLEPVKTKLDSAVAAGRLTQADANSMLAGLKARVTDFVNGRLPRPFGEFRERHGFRGPSFFPAPPPPPLRTA